MHPIMFITNILTAQITNQAPPSATLILVPKYLIIILDIMINRNMIAHRISNRDESIVTEVAGSIVIAE